MDKHWFFIQSCGATVDLSLVTQVVWNKKLDGRYHTTILFGTDIAYSPHSGVMGNVWVIADPIDRTSIQAMLILLGLPTEKLKFEESSKCSDKGKQINKQELIETICEREELNIEAVGENWSFVYDKIFSTIVEAVAQGKTVEIPEFGNFRAVKRYLRYTRTEPMFTPDISFVDALKGTKDKEVSDDC